MSTVAEVMKKNVLVIRESMSFTEAFRLFTQMKIHHLPVLNDEGKIIGMLSTNDMMRAIGYRLPALREVSEQKLNATFSIGELMTPQPITIRPDADLNRAVDLFSKHHIQSLPVIDNGNLEGILTSHDLIDYLATQQ